MDARADAIFRRHDFQRMPYCFRRQIQLPRRFAMDAPFVPDAAAYY